MFFPRETKGFFADSQLCQVLQMLVRLEGRRRDKKTAKKEERKLCDESPVFMKQTQHEGKNLCV